MATSAADTAPAAETTTTTAVSSSSSVMDVTRVIFLDIDGVLNRVTMDKQIRIEPELVTRLKRIIDIDGAATSSSTDNSTASSSATTSNADAALSNTNAQTTTSRPHIVLSTYWRYFTEYITYILARQGIPSGTVIGRTPGIPPKLGEVLGLDPPPSSPPPSSSPSGNYSSAEYLHRAAEIRAYLAEHPSITHFVILDDRDVAGPDASLLPHFVRTDHSTGLTDENTLEAIRILSHIPWNGGN